MQGARLICNGVRASIRIAGVLWLAGLAGLCVAASGAGAYVYWANGEAGTIGRATNDGSRVEPNFISGISGPVSLAVTDSHIYWASGGAAHEIGRASISGGSVEPGFIPLTYEVNAVAINEAHLYWSAGNNSLVGRSDLEGSNVEPEFISGVDAPCGLAFDSGHIYWASGTLTPGHIGRAGLSGTPVDNGFVTVSPVGVLCGVAVSSSSVYWEDNGLGGGTNIGRASLNNPGSPDVSFIGAALGPCGLTIHESKLYWANSGTSTIARANTDGTAVEYEWIHTGAAPKRICGVAVDDLAPPPSPSPSPPGGGGSDLVPPQTKITKGPGKKLAHGKAKFSFASSEAGSSFQCKLDRKKTASCRSPKTYSGLKPGRHTLSVWATDGAGNKDQSPAKRSFRVPG